MAKHPYFAILALLIALPLQSFALPRQMEAINRGLLVSNVGKSGMLVSWRLLGTEDSGTEFNLYRDGEKIATIGSNAGTNYLDAAGKVTSKYAVAAVVGGKEGPKLEPSIVLDSTVVDKGKSFPYKVLKLDRPASQVMPDSENTVCNYYPDDMSVGDLDGDGEYELVVKWIPDNYKDNSQSMVGSYTGTVFIDAYELDGTKLWRVNLGRNIRAGAHYTQFQVFDYDGDGKAEMVVKTGDGTIDGKGKVIGDSTKDYRNASGMIITGPEYLTVFNHANIVPVIINFASKGQAGTQLGICFMNIINLTIGPMITNSTGDLNVVSFLFQSSYANAQSIQFICEFSSQFVNVGAFGHSFRYDLCHFITGHQAVATESVVAIAFDYAGSS